MAPLKLDRDALDRAVHPPLSPRSIERGSIEADPIPTGDYTYVPSPRSIERGSIEAACLVYAATSDTSLHVRLNVAPLKHNLPQSIDNRIEALHVRLNVAPLKPTAAASLPPRYQDSPRSIERGSIEAALCVPRQCRPRPLSPFD